MLLCLEGPYSSTCGYCGAQPGTRSPSASSHSYGAYPMDELDCFVYMDMLDQGWRRSGKFLYKPDMKRTCCPQYTIRSDALAFSPSRSQRQVTNRWTRYVLEGDKQDSYMGVENAKQKHGRTKPNSLPFDLVTAIHSSEAQFISDGSESAHHFQVTLEPSIFTYEKFDLYKSYQREIHKELDEKFPISFARFLVETPLMKQAIPYSRPPPSHLPKEYGSYHQCYRLDGELIAMAVLDILPGCVSSVYFMYDKRWERFSLGKVSALREAALAREIHDAGAATMNSLYMGFYVYSCAKMRYKGDYKPSYLLDPEEYTWYSMEACIPILERHRYACFAHPENSLEEDPGPEEVKDIPLETLALVRVLEASRLIPLTDSPSWHDPETKQVIKAGVNALGAKVACEFTLLL
ncbi:arginine-tRNA-protein transferase [Gautieria morchelliformis]|nr:arginine-tRNA-protein transferase [Gautieria morchelliformis]